MLIKIFLFLIGLSPNLKKSLWRWWYQLLADAYQKPDWCFMNYGYVDLNSENSPIQLDPEDEDNRLFIQLYNYVATATSLEGKKVLEVGSGRGGGAAYVAKYLKPNQMIGVDFSESNIQVSRKLHQLSNLSFQQGDAENLPFANDTFDVVLNVESSHCYGSMENFVQEVHRVLKPGGIFSWADMRPIQDVESLKEAFTKSGLNQLKSQEITPNVLTALELINEFKQTMIEANVNPFLKEAFQEFAAVKDGQIYQAFQNKTMIYLSYVFQKTPSV